MMWDGEAGQINSGCIENYNSPKEENYINLWEEDGNESTSEALCGSSVGWYTEMVLPCNCSNVSQVTLFLGCYCRFYCCLCLSLFFLLFVWLTNDK